MCQHIVSWTSPSHGNHDKDILQMGSRPTMKLTHTGLRFTAFNCCRDTYTVVTVSTMNVLALGPPKFLCLPSGTVHHFAFDFLYMINETVLTSWWEPRMCRDLPASLRKATPVSSLCKLHLFVVSSHWYLSSSSKLVTRKWQAQVAPHKEARTLTLGGTRKALTSHWLRFCPRMPN